MEKEVVTIGKKCMSNLKSILDLLSKGKTNEAIQKLLLLKTDGIEFAEKIQDLLSYKERLQFLVTKAELNGKRSISNCTHHLLALMEKQVKMLSDLERNTVLFFHFRYKLEQSQDELVIATQATKMLSNDGTLARKGINHSKLVRSKSNEPVKDELFRKETKIRSIIEHNKLQLRAAGAILDGFQKRLKENKQKVADFEAKLASLKVRKSSNARKMLRVKQNIAFLSNLFEFWSLMHRLSNESADNIQVARLIADKASENMVSSSAAATRMLATTLAEAMESEMLQAEKGYSHALSFGFLCDGCNTICSTAPHEDSCMLVCDDCHGSMVCIKT